MADRPTSPSVWLFCLPLGAAEEERGAISAGIQLAPDAEAQGPEVAACV